jgi:hypothetical protein
MRVLKNGGTLIFKWSDVEFSVSEVLKAIGHTPLLGQKTTKHAHWFVFFNDCDVRCVCNRIPTKQAKIEYLKEHKPSVTKCNLATGDFYMQSYPYEFFGVAPIEKETESFMDETFERSTFPKFPKIMDYIDFDKTSCLKDYCVMNVREESR